MVPIPRSLRFGVDALRTSAHLTRSFVTGHRHRDAAAFERWRSLHCQSNGASTDALSALIAALSRRVHFDTVDGVLGTQTQRDRRGIVRHVEADGFYVWPTLVDAALVERLRAYAFAHESDAYPIVPRLSRSAVFDASAPHAPTCWHPQAALFRDATVQALVTDPTLVAIAADYLHVVPRISTLALWHSSHRFDEASEQGAQAFHFDLSYPRWLKVFIYLSDVTVDSGAHVYVKGSHRCDAEGAHLRRRGIQRVPDDDIIAAYGRERVIDIVGKAGTVFVADTRGWHKGRKPTTADRLVFQAEYANCAFTGARDDVTAPAATPRVAALAQTYPELFELFSLSR